MAIRYLQTGDDNALPRHTSILIEDDSYSWWAGVNNCFARAALATALAVTTLSTAQAVAQYSRETNDVPQHTVAQPEEDFWPQSVLPVPVAATLKSPQQWSFESSDVVPQAAAFQPDEDFWFNQLFPAPVPASLVYSQQWAF